MKRARVRRYVTGFQVVASASLVAALLHCGGGDKPDAQVDFGTADSGRPDTGSTIQPTSPIALDVDVNAGIDFGESGFVNCGGQSPDRTVTLTNTSRDIVNFTAKITDGDTRFKVSPAEGGIAPGGKQELKISASPIPATAAVTEDAFAGTLQLLYGSTPTTIRLHQTGRGASIAFSTGEKITIGDTQVGKTKASPLTITNSGNAPAKVKLKLGAGPFTITTGNSPDPAPGDSEKEFELPPKGNQGLQVIFAPTSSGPTTGSLSVAVEGGVCSATPASVPIEGNGTTTAGTAITLDPPTLNFGEVPCGTAIAPQNVTLESVVTTQFTPDLLKGDQSPFTLERATGQPIALGQPIDIAAGQQFIIKVKPKAIPARPVQGVAANAFGDTMTIKSPVDPIKNYSLTQTAKGVIYTFNPTIINTTAGADTSVPFTLVNNGNVEGKYVLVSTAGPCNICGVERTVQGSASSAAGVQTVQGFDAGNSNGRGSIHVKYVPSNDPAGQPIVLCADLPGDIIINSGQPQLPDGGY